MRVKYKETDEKIHVVEAFEVYQLETGKLAVYRKYRNSYNEIRANILCFQANDTDKLLDKVYETGLLDLTNAVFLGKLDKNNYGGCLCLT